MIVFTSLFGLLSLIHLYFCFTEKEKLRIWTKPFLLILLGAALSFYVPSHPLIPIACFFSAIGDVFLIWNKKRVFFALGALFFGLNHILNMITQCQALLENRTVILYVGIMASVILVALVGFLFYSFDWMGIVLCGFSSLHLTNVILSILSLAMGYLLPGILVLIGYLFCISSDLILSRATFKKDFPRRDFYIMLTYLLGQSFTYFGLALLTLV